MAGNNFSAIQIGLASPEKILEWSHGEVTKPETINYRSQKPEKDGLFCEKIFGPTKDWECSCGKYKKITFKGTVCDRCGVEVTKSSVRRERMGHISLAAPVAHIWYLKGIPSRMGLILDMPPKKLEEIIYFISFVVVDKGTAEVEYKQVLSEKEYRENRAAFPGRFVAKTGAEAVKILLQKVDLDKEYETITEGLKTAKGQNREKLLKRLDAVEAFRNSDNDPSWMIMDVLPVIPPDLRPMLQLDGGRFATSDLNDLYRRVINRNNRLKKMLTGEPITPSIVVQNEKRMLQEAVDALIDNGRGKSKPVTGPGGRQLKSLSNTLKGKQGRFRQNLLGKRVDYSGRSVIAVGPDLEMHECGIPREMALNLFKPFVIAGLIKKGTATNIKSAEKLIEKMDDSIWPVVEDVIKVHPVLLNRAPTLHRLGIQAFRPKLVEGRAIRLHPLMCPAFNADFDGDQMAVHVPLSPEAVEEAYQYMLGSNNILGPKDGRPIVTPSQDMVLGNYYLTTEVAYNDVKDKYAADDAAGVKHHNARPGEGEGTVFTSVNECLMAYAAKTVHLHTRCAIPALALNNPTFKRDDDLKREDIARRQAAGEDIDMSQVKFKEDCYLITSVGKIIFNQIFVDDESPFIFPFINDTSAENLKATPEKYFVPMGTDIKAHIAAQEPLKPFKKSTLEGIIDEAFKQSDRSQSQISKMLDRMKNQGFKYSTIAGITVSVSDIQIPEEKQEKFKEADATLERIQEDFDWGKLSERERYEQVIKLWTDTKDDVEGVVKKQFESDRQNPIFIMSDSGARGSLSNFTQLVGMRGLMSNPKGETIELPIRSALREGLTASEFFISTHGARKGSTDTALKTADSGYLTRRLVDVAQSIVITEDDCGTDKGFVVTELANHPEETDPTKRNVFVSLSDRLIGRYSIKDIIHPETGEIIVPADTLMDEFMAEAVEKAGIKEVEIRSVFGCKAKNGLCCKCYGRNLATGQEVEQYEAVGIMAAQSIGEPGTQLTMRTFHQGGVAGGEDITQGLPRIQELFEARNPKAEAIICEIDGVVDEIILPDDPDYKDKIKDKMAKRTKKSDQDIRIVTIRNDVEETPKVYEIKNVTAKLAVSVGDRVHPGSKITEGSINPKQLLAAAGTKAVEEYILYEVQKTYRGQGIAISDKHIAIIISQMLKHLIVLDGGDTTAMPGEHLTRQQFTDINRDKLKAGERPAVAQPMLQGITKASLDSESWLSSASFQETTRILTSASIHGSVDHLEGLKENVIIGHLLPAGTGLRGPLKSAQALEEERLAATQQETLLESEKEGADYHMEDMPMSLEPESFDTPAADSDAE